MQASNQCIAMLFSRKFEDSLLNPQVKAELVSYKDPEKKKKTGRFECILPFVSVNLILMETTKFLVQETVPLSLSKKKQNHQGYINIHTS